MNTITWTQKARRQLHKIDRSQQQQIVDAVDTLANLNTARNVTKLSAHVYGYRLRVGATE